MNEELRQEDEADAPDVAVGEATTEGVPDGSAGDQPLAEAEPVDDEAEGESAPEVDLDEEAPQDDEPTEDATEDAAEPNTDDLMEPDEAPLDVPDDGSGAGAEDAGEALLDEEAETEVTSEDPKSEEDASASTEGQPVVMPAPVVDTPPALAVTAAPAKVRYTGAATVRLVEAYRWDAKNKFTCLVAEPDLVALLLEDGEFEVIEA